MKKVCIQAGHGWLSGGAPGEMLWTQDTVLKMKDYLKDKCEVLVCGKQANEDEVVTKTDWDLFLSVHYDADIYNDRGGFTDYPEPSTDGATAESQRLSKAIGNYFFTKTGIPQKPQRSNANTRYYYMWKYLSSKTPCVIIECGVGNRKPEDYNTLRLPTTPEYLAQAVLNALGIADTPTEMNWDYFDPKEDIPAEPEDRMKLKDYSWYDNHWTWLDWVDYTNDLFIKSKEDEVKLEDLKKQLTDTNTTLEDVRAKNQTALDNLNNELNKLKTTNFELEKSLDSCKRGQLDHLTLKDFFKWMGRDRSNA